jgi:hypothetical protein
VKRVTEEIENGGGFQVQNEPEIFTIHIREYDYFESPDNLLRIWYEMFYRLRGINLPRTVSSYMPSVSILEPCNINRPISQSLIYLRRAMELVDA